VFTCADVQQNGIFYETIAIGRDRQCWSIDADFLEGETADADGEVWKLLAERWNQGWYDSFGNRRVADAEGVDTGYNSNAAYNFARNRHRCKALKGEDGWHKPALGSPNKVDVTYRGKKRRGGVMLWPVGTWSLKSALYSALALKGVKEGEPADPPGYCHFTETLHGKPYFEQLTAESLKKTDKHGKPLLKNGRPVSIWYAHGPNHFHDCRIYNMAIADHYGVGNFTTDRWAEIAADRERAAAGAQGDLLAAMNAPIAVAKTVQAPSGPVAPQPDAPAPSPTETKTAAERMLARLTGKR
jgi:phage terminase large subunit GpA-like protein